MQLSGQCHVLDLKWLRPIRLTSPFEHSPIRLTSPFDYSINQRTARCYSLTFFLQDPSGPLLWTATYHWSQASRGIHSRECGDSQCLGLSKNTVNGLLQWRTKGNQRRTEEEWKNTHYFDNWIYQFRNQCLMTVAL